MPSFHGTHRPASHVAWQQTCQNQPPGELEAHEETHLSNGLALGLWKPAFRNEVTTATSSRATGGEAEDCILLA